MGKLVLGHLPKHSSLANFFNNVFKNLETYLEKTTMISFSLLAVVVASHFGIYRRNKFFLDRPEAPNSTRNVQENAGNGIL